MRLPFAALLAALFLAVGCGGGGLGLGISDGGPVGTGIAASVVGNVVTVEDPDGTFGTTEDIASVAAAPEDDPLAGLTSVDGIDVSIVELPDVATTTDAEGNFSLDGDFDGALTLRFRTPDIEVDQLVEVPSGGIVVLSDIELNRDGVIAEAGQQLGLVGRVRSTDCAGSFLQVEDRRDRRFDIMLVDETRFIRGDATISCDEIRNRDDVSIEGLQDDLSSRRITALVVELDPDDSAPRPVERRAAFLGNIVALDCPSDRLAVHNGDNLVQIQLNRDTRIETMQGRRVSCEDLRLTLRVTGEGILDLRRPGLVRAERLTIGGALSPGANLPIRGLIVGANCDQAIYQIAFQGAVVAVRVTGETVIRAGREFRCEDALNRQLSVRGKGVVSTEVPGGIDALEIEIKQVKKD